MLQAVSKTAGFLKSGLNKSASAGREVVETGKNFLFWIDKENDRAEDVPEKVKGKSSPDSEEQNTHHKEDPDLSKLQRVVEEMGLSYFFVLKDVPNVTQFEPKTSSVLSIPLREASQLLAELGFSSEDILSLQTQLKIDGSLDLQVFVNFLFSQSPVNENAAINGSNLSKLLSAISIDANPLHFSLDPQKEFSIGELRSIFGRVLRLNEESRRNLETATLDISYETDGLSETTFNDGVGLENRFGVRQRDLKDAFAKTVVGGFQTFEEKETIDLQDSRAKIGNHEEILKESYQQSMVNNSLNSGYAKERLFNHEIQTELFQGNLGDSFERGVEFYRYGNLVDNENVFDKSVGIGQDGTIKTNYVFEDLPLESDVRVHSNINNNVIRVDSSETLSDPGNSKSDQNFSFQTHGSDIIQSKDIQDNPVNGIQGFAQILAQDQESPAVSNGVNRIAIVAHVSEQITQMRQLNQNSVVLQLDPPELGRVVIKISVRDNRVSTSIVAENEEIRDLLNKNTEFLKRYLEEHGLFLDEFSVETSTSDSGTRSGSEQDHKFSGSDDPTLLQSFTSKEMINFPELAGNSIYENREHLIYLFA